MAEIGSLSVSIGLDGAQFSRSVKEINGQLRLLDSEFKNATVGVDRFSTNLEDLGNRQAFLNDKIGLQKEKVEQLRREFQTLATSTTATATQIRNAETAYNNANTTLKKTEQQLSQVTKQLNTQQTVWGRIGTSAGQMGTQLDAVGSKMQMAGANIAMSFGVATAAVGVGLKKSVDAAADFESQLSSIKAVSGATSSEMKTLSNLAVEYGSKTKYSSLEAAQGIEELIKAGVSMSDIVNGGLEGALSLATAGSLDLAQAAEIASTALNAFKDDNLSVAQAADLLAGGANASATSVGDLQFGLSQVSAVASGVGLSFKDTTTALSLFANSGLKGSDAGTSLKTMLSNLSPKSKEATEQMKQLGIVTEDGANSFYDAQGNIKSMSDIAGILESSLKGLNAEQRQQALYTMFGSDAIRAANILYKEGADGVKNMYTEMSKVKAADVAAEKMNNFKGKMEELKGATETAKISIGNALIPVITKLTSFLQSLVDGFNSLSPGMQKAIAITLGLTTVVLGLVTGIGILLTIIGGAATGIGALVTLFGTLSASIATAGGAMAIITGPIGIAVGAIIGLIAVGVLLYKNWDVIKAKTIEAWNFIGNKAREIWGPTKEYILTIVESIKTYLLEKWNVIKNDAMAIFNGLKTYFTGWFTVVKNLFVGSLLLLVQLFTGDFRGMKDTAIQIFNNIRSGISQMFEGIKGIFSGALGIIKSAWSGAWSGLVSVVSSLGNSITSTVSNITSRVVSTFRSINLVDIGRNIINGLISGISGAVGALWQKLTDVANGIKKKLKNVLDINSPSKVMEKEIGKWIPAGIGEGIENNMKYITNATDKMADATMPQNSQVTTNNNYTSPVNVALNYSGNGSTDDAMRMVDIIQNELYNRMQMNNVVSGVTG